MHDFNKSVWLLKCAELKLTDTAMVTVNAKVKVFNFVIIRFDILSAVEKYKVLINQ
jgi:hypothetical protein